ncbi:MAG TPA: FtsX-like permease family protein [Verrucomicrobiae bacterium]|nr:FtsX-like permease family protein [Verrucomicrobiae bacterium]
MWRIAFRNLVRRPWRTTLVLAGLALAVAVLGSLLSFGHGYQQALETEISQMGVQLMLVPLGCPYDAAARVIKGKGLDTSLPYSALGLVQRDPAVSVAAPLLMVAVNRSRYGQADMWVGLDEAALALKPWWHAASGSSWFNGEDSVVLGSDAAEIEMRSPGDLFFSPETGFKLRVAGVLERSGTSDDSMFFVPLRTAERMFHQTGRLTAVAVRLKDPAQLPEASARLQRIAGAQVVTLAEMMGTFLNLVGSVRTLLLSIALVALTVSVLGILNTLLAAVLERTRELAVMRAVGASRAQVVLLIVAEALLLSGMGSVAGIGLSLAAGQAIEHFLKQLMPLAPAQSLLAPTPRIFFECAALGVAAGLVGCLYPGWRAARLHPAEALRSE